MKFADQISWKGSCLEGEVQWLRRRRRSGDELKPVIYVKRREKGVCLLSNHDLDDRVC